jgi:hypothetical protein
MLQHWSLDNSRGDARGRTEQVVLNRETQKGESGNFANLSGAVRERVLLKVRIVQPYRAQHRHESSHVYQTVADMSYRR